MAGYRVVPETLRASATQITEVATAWQKATTTVRSATLGADDYGLLGRSLVTTYNQMVNQMATDFDTGHQRINTAATTLNAVATGYENLDFSFYRKFGYLAR